MLKQRERVSGVAIRTGQLCIAAGQHVGDILVQANCFGGVFSEKHLGHV